MHAPPAAAPPRQTTPEDLLGALERHPLVNLVGPLGCGKSSLAARLAPLPVVDLESPGAADALRSALAEDTARPLVADGADGPAGLAALDALRDRAPGGRPVLVVSRRSLLSRPGWALSGARVVPFRTLRDEEVRGIAERAQVHDPRALGVVTDLAAGNPFIAEAACRALHGGAAAEPGAVAVRVAPEILDRLDREAPGRAWADALQDLASVWGGDQETIGVDGEAFAALAGLSVVYGTEAGLVLSEPFRRVLALARRTRQPSGHRETRGRAAAHRRRMLLEEPPGPRRGRILEGIIALSDEEAVQATLFPGSPEDGLVRPASADDADTVGELMNRWAGHSGLDPRRTDRLVEGWMRTDPDGFLLVHDARGEPVGVSGLLRVEDRTIDSVEPLLQQHTDTLLTRYAGAGHSLLLGAAFCPDRGLHAQLLRSILHRVMALGLYLTVSTVNPGYQRLLHALRFRHHGGTVDDVYRCGRGPEVHGQDFGSDAFLEWAERLAAPAADAGGAGALGREVRHALTHIDSPGRLRGTPLLALSGAASPADLRARLREEVRALAASGSAEEAEAGRILEHYYLDGVRGHERLAIRLHLSRATYFRRLRYGLELIGLRLVRE
ncbi:hypothetical protein ABZ249_25080 [Nocardiopsis sp. NPDC006139]|uniref:hypothetical protein n=1 Tax=Nocardiopsis sp. NPDC006139 TaxID=3154578 RepID=UPI0033A52AD6